MLSAVFNIILMALAAGFFGLVVGFYFFWQDISRFQRPVDPKADAIIVLTGGYQRIEQAITLLKDGAGKRLLISGVNPAITDTQIRRFTNSSKALFECCIDIGYEAIDTSGNAEEAARWIGTRGFKSVIVVTNNYHMPRSLLELRRIDNQTLFIAYPVPDSGLNIRDVIDNPYLAVTLTSEYFKTLLAASRDWLPSVE